MANEKNDISKLITIDDCVFYHTMEIPEQGIVQGQWDLRGREAEYLGNIEFKNKSVLEVGTASGHLGFFMEKQGAQVTAYDLSENDEWDVVPYADVDIMKHMVERKDMIRRINNGFWYAHHKFKSQVKMVYGSVYNCPNDLGMFDIGTFGSILLHLRDPLLAIQKISEHIKETIVITDFPLNYTGTETSLEYLTKGNLSQFVPSVNLKEPILDTWWNLSPDLVIEFIKILGYKYVHLSFHSQLFQGKEYILYTIIGQRTKPFQDDKVYHSSSISNDSQLFLSLSRIRLVDLMRYIVRRLFQSVKRRFLE